jgi:ribonuclease HI
LSTARSKTAGAGAVARDHLGAVLFAACAPVENCDDAEEAEARAALMGVELISQLAPAKVILELDCTAAVAALRSVHKDRSTCWTIYQEAKDRIATLKECVLSYSKRSTNGVADCLAKLASQLGNRIMTENLPMHIKELVKRDSDSVTDIL